MRGNADGPCRYNGVLRSARIGNAEVNVTSGDVVTDVMKPEQRRRAMQSNRGRTGPERRLASALWRRGLRFFTAVGYKRLSGRKLLGQPDLIFPSSETIVFMDGCFWHGCDECHDFEASCNERWKKKIARNVERDTRTTEALREQGWRVFRVWEHELSAAEFERTVDRLAERLRTLGGGRSNQ